MKKLLTILICLLPLLINAQVIHYVSSSTGNDANDGLNTTSAWQTIAKVNSTLTPAPGDQILFKRGDIFYGTITVATSGTSGNPITYGTYGTGANPIITSFTTVPAWTNLGSNIWESTSAISTLSTCNIVVINGVNTPMGRTPNTGWYNTDATTSTSITSSSLTGTPNFTGATIAARTLSYTVNTGAITSQSGSTINFAALPNNPQTNYGFFIEAAQSTLDQPGEWYYNTSTKKIDVYSTSTPTGVQVPTIANLVDLHYRDFITFHNLDFVGSNQYGFFIGSSKNDSIISCSINYMGNAGVYGENYAGGNYSNHTVIDSCTLIGNIHEAIHTENYSKELIVSNCTINKTGEVLGTMPDGGGTNGAQATAIVIQGDSSLITNNTIKNSGYIGILFRGNGTILSKNLVDSFCTLFDDGGGIYTAGYPAQNGLKVDSNIVLNGINATAGTNSTLGQSFGIYMDDYANDVEIYGNSVAHTVNAGIYLHKTDSINVHNNTVYDSGDNGDILLRNDSTYGTNSKILSNKFIAKNSGDRTITVNYGAFSSSYMALWGTADFNYYAHPVNTSSDIDAVYSNADHMLNLASWQSLSGQDSHSNTTVKTTTSVDSLTFVYNPNNYDSIITLPYKYEQVDGTINDGTITLAPHYSAVLIQDGAKTPSPQTIILNIRVGIIKPINIP